MRMTLLRLVVFIAAAAASFCTFAQTYPMRPVRLVLPAAGGGTDILSRLIARQLTEALGESVIVDNRPAVDGIVGTEIVARAAPDGHTLLIVSSSHAINVALGRKLPYDTIRDFAPITHTTSQHLLLTVNPSVPVKTVKELIDYLKARPGKLNYASSSNGTALPMELFKSLTATNVQHIPYKGSAQVLAALLSGEVQMSMAATVAAMPHLKAGKLRALGIGALQRAAFLPDVPTMAEAGVPGYQAEIWTGMFAPAKTPRAVVERLNNEVVRILHAPDFRERVAALGADVVGNTTQEWGKFVLTETRKWTEIAKIAGFKIEQ